MSYKAMIGIVLCCLNAVFLPSTAYAEKSPDVPDAWRSYIEPLLPIGESLRGKLTDPNDPQLQADLYNFIYGEIARAWIGLSYGDPDYPEFLPLFNRVFTAGFPNPDDSYSLAFVDDDGIYKIAGYRGSVRIADFQVQAGSLNRDGTGNFGRTLVNIDINTLRAAENGYFEFILSSERPEGYDGDWRKLDKTATSILVRQIAYDWLNEVDGRFTIERLDVPATRPHMSSKSIETALHKIPLWVKHWPEFSMNWYQRIRDRGLVNELVVMDYGHSNGISNQKYAEGVYAIDEGEALIITLEVPQNCRYWSFQVVDEFWRQVEGSARQTNINGFTAKIDADGKFRAVVSAVDPGVPNWIDTAGYKKGLIYGRYKECDTNPKPEVKKVAIKKLRKHLPIETAVVTAKERDAAMRLRRQGAQLRRSW